MRYWLVVFSIDIFVILFRMILNNKIYKNIDMIKKILFVASLLSVGYSYSQVLETVSMNASYSDENYYTLDNDNKVTAVRSDWDLAFASDGVGGGTSTVRINGGMGTELYKYSNNISDWATVDTTGFSWSTNQLVNSDTSWTTGAFENTTPASGFDLGWGTYNMITHIVEGDKIFILKLANGDYKKLIINSLISGIYSFQYDNLDGSSLVNTTIDKSSYAGKNFGYYSIQNTQEIDREPVSDTWDLVFTKYVTDLGGGTYYPVTGVLSNNGITVAQVNNVGDVNNITHLGHNYETKINTIGYDWKSYSFSTNSYVITDSLVYFIELPNDDIYKVIFTDFGGSANGDFIFTKEKVFSVGVEEKLIESEILNIYPNPATESVNVTFVNAKEGSKLSLYDLAGKELIIKNIISNSGLTQQEINISHLSKGTYILMLTSDNSRKTQKIIIQ
jgi:hypothetical protein